MMQVKGTKLMMPVLVIGMMMWSVAGLTDDPDSYQDLDRNIIHAYNRNPRNTADVYLNSMKILEKVANDKSSTATPWELKARKLITLSCYYECTQAIDRKLYRLAYIWARRGEKRGTTIGKIGNVPVKNLYEYLSFAGRELQETPMVKNSSQEELRERIDNYRDAVFMAPRPSMVAQWFIITPQWFDEDVTDHLMDCRPFHG